MKFTFKKTILTIVTLLKPTLGVTWQIMPLIIIITDILNLYLISRTCTREVQKRTKEKRKKKLN